MPANCRGNKPATSACGRKGQNTQGRGLSDDVSPKIGQGIATEAITAPRDEGMAAQKIVREVRRGRRSMPNIATAIRKRYARPPKEVSAAIRRLIGHGRKLSAHENVGRAAAEGVPKDTQGVRDGMRQGRPARTKSRAKRRGGHSHGLKEKAQKAIAQAFREKLQVGRRKDSTNEAGTRAFRSIPTLAKIGRAVAQTGNGETTKGARRASAAT